MSVSSCPSGDSRPPKYLKQKRKGKPDRAYTRIDGKRVYLGDYGTKESRAQYARVLAEAQLGPLKPEPSANPTVSELMAAYLEHVEEYCGHKSAEWYHCKSFMMLLREHYGALPACEFKAKRLKELREYWVGNDWSRKYINEHVARLRRMYKWATSEEMVPTEVYQSLDSVAGLRKGKCKAHDNEPIKPVPDADVEKTLPHLPEQVATMVQVQRYCGCRPGELLKIRKMDINRTGDVWVVKLAKHKTLHHGKQRHVYFGPKSQALLLPRLVCGDEDVIFPMRRDSYRRAV
jgi:integrase